MRRSIFRGRWGVHGVGGPSLAFLRPSRRRSSPSLSQAPQRQQLPPITQRSVAPGTACSSASPCALTEALSKATSGSTVDLAAAPISLQLKRDFTIATSITVQPTTPGSSVILEGNENAVVLVDAAATATISGVTIIDGSSTFLGGSEYTDGGGIYNLGVLTIQNCTVSNNTTEFYGAGIYNGKSLAVLDSTISDNPGSTGGVFNDGGTLVVQGSTFAGNEGRGIWVQGGTATIIDSTVTGTYGVGSAAILCFVGTQLARQLSRETPSWAITDSVSPRVQTQPWRRTSLPTKGMGSTALAHLSTLATTSQMITTAIFQPLPA